MKMVVGIDSGSTTTKVVLMEKGQVKHYLVNPTGPNSEITAIRMLQTMQREYGFSEDDIEMIVATGYGRSNITIANKQITEITCHAKGASALFPEAQAIIDIGGQDSKVIKIDSDGKVLDFVMNEKCAAGTGRFLDVMSRVLEVDISDIGPLSLTSREPVFISSTCTVFAESEVISHIARGTAVGDILAGICSAISSRVYGLGRRLLKDCTKVVFTGGVAKNQGIIKGLEERLGFPLLVPPNPQIVGAIGAAYIGQENLKDGGKGEGGKTSVENLLLSIKKV